MNGERDGAYDIVSGYSGITGSSLNLFYYFAGLILLNRKLRNSISLKAGQVAQHFYNV